MWLLYLLASFRPSYASHSSPSSFSVRSVLDLQNQNTSAILKQQHRCARGSDAVPVHIWE